MKVVNNSSTMVGLGRFAKNTGLALGHKGQSVLQEPMAFKVNAMALSSLLLVVARVVVASFSAAKAQGTPDANYRAQESIRTDIREVGGFLSSYGIILGATYALKSQMKHAWGIKEGEGYALWKNIGKAMKNRHNANYRTETPNWGDKLSGPEAFTADASRAKRFIATINFMRRSIGKQNMVKPLNALEKTYRWTPVVISGGIALYVSGMLLERFTRNHSNDVVEWINKQATASQPLEPENFSVPGYALPPRLMDHPSKKQKGANQSPANNPFFNNQNAPSPYGLADRSA